MTQAAALIHPTALIDPAARLAADVEVGPFSVIGADVVIGAGSRVGSHCLIEGPTAIGQRNHIYSCASIGTAPQDKKYVGQPTELHIGDDNTFREFVTINRGTSEGGGLTSIGNDNWIMAYVHIAHDCHVGSHTIFANCASLAGHVIVEDFVILGGFSLIHQFCKIGQHAFTSMGSRINCDVPPFVVVAGEMSVPRGINSEGLKRRGFTREQIAQVKQAYRLLYSAGLPLAEARERLAELSRQAPHLDCLSDFLSRTERGILR